MTEPAKVAIYLRVSKRDGTQTTENQRPEVEAVARQRGEIVRAYVEQGSAAKKRPVFQEMMQAARAGEFSCLVVWALDRFGRSLTGNMVDLLELDKLGVCVVSVRETWLDTCSPMRNLLVAIFSWCAEQERARLSERVKAGLETARGKGKRLGRKPFAVDVAEGVRLLTEERLSQRAAAKRMGLSLSVFHRALKPALDALAESTRRDQDAAEGKADAASM